MEVYTGLPSENLLPILCKSSAPTQFSKGAPFNPDEGGRGIDTGFLLSHIGIPGRHANGTDHFEAGDHGQLRAADDQVVRFNAGRHLPAQTRPV